MIWNPEDLNMQPIGVNSSDSQYNKKEQCQVRTYDVHTVHYTVFALAEASPNKATAVALPFTEYCVQSVAVVSRLSFQYGKAKNRQR